MTKRSCVATGAGMYMPGLKVHRNMYTHTHTYIHMHTHKVTQLLIKERSRNISSLFLPFIRGSHTSTWLYIYMHVHTHIRIKVVKHYATYFLT